MVEFLGFYAAAELSHFVEIVPKVPVSAVKFVRWYLGHGLSPFSPAPAGKTGKTCLIPALRGLSQTGLAAPGICWCMGNEPSRKKSSLPLSPLQKQRKKKKKVFANSNGTAVRFRQN
jgi:hypothetical protein